MDSKRYLIVILGLAKGIDDDLNNIAEPEHGVHYVDGNGIFIGTFFSHFSSDEIYSLLVHRPAFMLFDITNDTDYAVNLPSKYYKGLFPEILKIVPTIEDDPSEEEETNESLTNVDDILDKLSKNSYDRACLTESEKNILDNFGS
jgi:hypothetical protein